MNKKLKAVAHKHRKKKKNAKLKLKEIRLKEQVSKEHKASETKAKEAGPEAVAEEVQPVQSVPNAVEEPNVETQTGGEATPESPVSPNP